MSTDDEFDSNNPLPDRIRMNKATCSGVRAKSSGCKQFKQNTRKKPQKQCSRNHSAAPKSPTKNQWMISETPSPYFIGPKKRQSGDKVEQTAHPKRTCLSDRFFISTQNQGKKNGCVDILPRKQSNESSQHLFPNVRFTLDKKSYMESTATFNDISPTHGSYPPSAATYNVPDMETPSSSSASSSCSSNNQSYSFSKDMAIDESLVRPSTSNYGQDKQKNGTSCCKSNALGVNFIDSESDESEVHLSSPPTNDERYQFCPLRKVIGKGLRRVLESDDDDSDDSVDDAHFPNNYRRGAPLISSDSDDSSDIPVVAKKSFKKRNLSQLSSTDSNDGSASSFVVYSPTHTRTSGLSKKNSSERSSDCSRSKNTRDHSYALRDVTREHTNSSSLSSSTSHSSKNRRDHSYPTRGASKRYAANSSSVSSSTSLSSQSNTSSSSADRNTRYPHRDSSVRQAISPLTLRVTRSRCQAGLSRSAMGSQSSNGQQVPHRAMNYPARYTEVFDPEESSEMEFFTANSDTEASISTVESLGDHNVPGNVSMRSRESNVTYSVSGSSPSEDEISVIFTTGSAFPDSTSRRVRHRGGGGRRRRTHGPPRTVSLTNTQDLTSVSPDPVEQVRQMEEDEQFARMLQAQFDAEINNRGEGNEAEEVFETEHLSTESDNESVHESLESILDTDIVPFPPPRGIIGAAIGPNHSHTRGRSRFAVPSNIMFLGGGRRRRGRRNHSVQGDPWMYQFARVLGLSPAYTSPDESEYETLLHFAETIGEEVPRGLRKTEINRLPTRKFYFPGAVPSTSQGYEDIVHKRTDLNKECQVCLSDYENGDVLRILPCFHEFHTPCIDPWLKINHTCPVCRVEVAFEQENMV